MRVASYVFSIAILLAHLPNKSSAQQTQQPDNKTNPPVTVNYYNTNQQQDAPKSKPEEPHTGIEYSQWAIVIVGIITLVVIVRQTIATANSAKASEKSAIATEQTAAALMNSERAWVLVELKCHPSTMISNRTSGDEITTAVLDVELYCTNHGTSPAWITEKSAKLVNTRELPPIPQLAEEDILSRIPEPIGPGKESIYKWTPSGDGHYSPLGSALIIYGVVRYRDIFQKDRETWFCQQLTGDRAHRTLIRIFVPPAYIKHT